MAESIVLGIVGIKNMGVYDADTNYEKLNVVTYQGSTYCAKQDSKGVLPTNSDYWQLYAEKGDTGNTGPQGPKPVKGIDYYTDTDKAEIERDLSDDIATAVSESVGTLTTATPLVAETVGDMVDTTRIYVLITDGHWYWYDGDSWEDGGVYQATGIETDKTLSIEDKAADAKTVGDLLDVNNTIKYLNVEFYKQGISTTNSKFFHTDVINITKDTTITFSGTYQSLTIKDLSDNTTSNVSNNMVVEPGSYQMEGYIDGYTVITDEILAQIQDDFTFTTTVDKVDIYNPTILESTQVRFKPMVEDDIQNVEIDEIEEFKYPTIPVWGHEYLQHWYKKVYEANSNATVVLDGDSITAGYNPKYASDPDTFIDMRGYAIKKIMKAGNYPLSQLTVVNNGRGGRKTGEWVGNPTYGDPSYISQYPNGFLDVAMQNNPDLLIIAWGMNDADKTNSQLSSLTLEERLDVFKNNMIEGLKRIRGNESVNGRPAYNKSMNDLSIIICMPTVGGSVASGRGNYLWNQYVREILRPLCREYGCAFADMTMRTYAHNDMSPRIWSAYNSTGTGYDNIHPNMYSSAQTMSMLQDLIYPVCMWNLGQIN